MSLLRDRFGQDPGADMQRFSCSLDIDLRMLDEDVQGSMAHVRMLGEVGLLAPEEVGALSAGLARVAEEIRDGDWVPGPEHEDIHMAVEARLIELVGAVGGKLHTARSRNDQVATDVRLWLKNRLPRLDAALRDLISALLERIERDGRLLMPGYTHLQRGQPIWLGHHLLAHAWALSRDRGRLADATRRLDECPLGACAMAGTSLPIDRNRTAELLGFARPMANAMDAVAARDYQHEVAAVCAIVMVHLSRMAEELVWWSSTEFGLVRLPDAYATGSSIMPNKRNPDAAELVRGKSARVIGDLQTLLTLVRCQPLSYNRDLQEDREPLFDAVETTCQSLEITAGIWATLQLRADRFETELAADFCLATELADHLVLAGLDFRSAHGIIGTLVRECEQQGTDLSGVTPERAAAAHPALAEALPGLLDPVAAAERRTSLGGTAWSAIKGQITTLREAVGKATHSQ